jgi:hypothetical protein
MTDINDNELKKLFSETFGLFEPGKTKGVQN